MAWPTYSPDLNRIEYIWVALKNSIHKTNPNLPTISGGALKVKEAIGKAVIECWGALGNVMFDRLIESMLRRVAAVIKAEGWYQVLIFFLKSKLTFCISIDPHYPTIISHIFSYNGC